MVGQTQLLPSSLRPPPLHLSTSLQPILPLSLEFVLLLQLPLTPVLMLTLLLPLQLLLLLLLTWLLLPLLLPLLLSPLLLLVTLLLLFDLERSSQGRSSAAVILRASVQPILVSTWSPGCGTVL